ncbi:SNF2 family N-terminal domain-containing protein [Cokeromyces recurvatus]|uniref:SNF2 family N-terminal domain-containing protein n=1 Tax=Cokeromyces recurvatus TaxID=90255 RepID=UPI0022208EF3|nr:SNF2 family N-terminal domain-containing protein [Cokeromyces recurvatus]KAI7898240.1 SNF2 family N-terminal domain-containing protein [Cokeromyces recurvatus]
MVTILDGSIGKIQALYDFLTELQVHSLLYETDVEANRNKRMKIFSENDRPYTSPSPQHTATIQFPISIPNADPAAVMELVKDVSQFHDQHLDIEWNYVRMDESIFASMKVFTLGEKHVIVENEYMCPSNHFQDDDTEVIENNVQLFIAIAYAAHTKLIYAYNIRLVSNTSSFNLQLDLKYGNTANRSTKLLTSLSHKVAIKEDNKVEAQYNKNDSLKPLSYASSSSSSSSINTTTLNVKKRHLVTNNNTTINLTIPPLPCDSTIEDFYNYLQPSVSNIYLEPYTSHKVTARLTPFQTQNVQWMIYREGQIINNDNAIIPNLDIYNNLPLLYAGSHDAKDSNRGSYLNLFTDVVSVDRLAINKLIDRSYRGGILADEMGLGKTISVLSLIAKHIWDPKNEFHPKPSECHDLVFSKGTLIIAPSSIIPQWQLEIKKHTPSLSVFIYEGRRNDRSILAKDLAQYDIVLTHYEAFRHEIYYATPRPKRPQRKGVRYNNEFKTSPLVNTLWFRCILDEAQMIEASLTRIAALTKSIPHWYAWAVTGTPIRSNNNHNFTDLYGLYDFLALETTLNSEREFKTFCTDPNYRPIFYQFASMTIRRNNKAALGDQIHIPKQSRHVVRIPFSTIEQHYYDDLWRTCRQRLRLDWLDSIEWSLPDDASEIMQMEYHSLRSKMRPWLLALRQNCIHPSMINNRTMRLENLGETNSTRGAKPLHDVLNDMLRNAMITLDNNQHAYYSMTLKHGGMYEVLQDWRSSYNVYLQHLQSVEDLVQHHADEVKKAQDLKKQKAITEGTNEISTILKYSSNTLMRWHLLLHQYYFYIAGICHRLVTEASEDGQKEEQESLENLYYTKATNIRRVLLENYTSKVKQHVKEVSEAARAIQSDNHNSEFLMGSRPLLDVNTFIEFFKNYYKQQLHPAADEEQQEADREEVAPDINILYNLKYLGPLLDRQYQKILYLRSKIIPILTKPLVDEQQQEEATGNEYEESLRQQELCQVYLSAYQHLLQDRKFIIKGTTMSVAEIIAAEGSWSIDENMNGDAVISPEAKQIEITENAFRKELMSPTGYKVECLRDVEFSLRALKTKYSDATDAASNKQLVLQREHEYIKFCLPIQAKLVDDIDNDFKKLSQLFNSRISYYKYLQGISDTLLEWEHKNPMAEIDKLKMAEAKLEEQIVQNKSRYHYFKVLMEEQISLEKEEKLVKKDCLICQEPIEKGIITYCGHTSCLDCGLLWFKVNRRCHTCNSKVGMNQWYNISYKQMEMHKKGESCSTLLDSNEDDERLKQLINEINKQQIVEGEGQKIDSIIRHIKHIKMTKNGKCVIFSQWAKALDMLKEGLKKNNINFIMVQSGAPSANKKNISKFQEDPNVNVILLHARSQSSGLTLVVAQTVFIVEPVLNESLEKQAINRIHRIGQTKETDVFWYIIQDTIEERIQAIHDVKREHHRNDKKRVTEERVELSKVSEGGGEYVNNDDLRRCFTSDEAYALS